jgi:hypothetical protein
LTDSVPGVPMKAITVRMGEDAYAQIAEAAKAEGVSFSQYLRESALARVWFGHGYRHGDTAEIGRVLLAVSRAADEARMPLDEYIRRTVRELGP